MNTQKMTIHRALAELKTLDKRITDKISVFDPVGGIRKDGKVNDFHDKSDFEKRAAADLESINDLLKRKDRIKSAIVLSNATTEVKVGGNVMKVSDAISKKQTIEMQKILITRMKTRLKHFTAEIRKANDEAESVSVKLAEAALGRSGVDLKEQEVKNIIEPYMEKHRFDLLDPLKITDVIEKKTDEVSIFETEVDAVLSESNALTIIEA